MKKLIQIIVIALFVNYANAQWSQFGTGPVINTMLVTGTYPSNMIYLGLNNDGVVYSANYGTSWTGTSMNSYWLPTTASALSIVQSGSKIIAGTDFGVFVSGGPTCSYWTKIYAGGVSGTEIYSLAASGSKVFAGTEYGIYVSNNGGTNWSTCISFSPPNIVNCIVIDGINIYAGTKDGFYSSIDNGINWTLSTGVNNVRSILTIDSLILVATLNGIYRSVNKGVTWSGSNTGISNAFVTSLAINGQNIYAGSLGYGAFASVDSGNTWSPFNNGLSTSALYIPIIVSEGQWLYAGTGDGVWRTSAYIGINELGNRNLGVSIYPNPSTSKIYFRNLKIDNSTIVTIENIYGEKIIEIELKNPEINISNLPPSLYIVKIQNKAGLSLLKFLKE